MSFANKILMVRPYAFGYNPETAESNVFQKESDLSAEEVQRRALEEFDRMVEGLRSEGIEVLVFNDKPEPHTPDAVFPNNWFSTHPGGTLCLYPMEAVARRGERDPDIVEAVEKAIEVQRKIDLTPAEEQGTFLEGTGSLILDQDNRIAYACISSRTDPGLLDIWAHMMKFQTVHFHSYDSEGAPIYHTNVMMCLGDRFAVVCIESVTDEAEREKLAKSLRDSGKEIIEISFQQMYDFAGNMILLRNKDDEKILVMSQRAFDSLEEAQVKKMESYAKLLAFDIKTIEDLGGGSARCMIAEIF